MAGFPVPHTTRHKEDAVSHYTPEQLIERWKREELTTEQTIGQILQVLRELEQRLREVARRLPPENGAAPVPDRHPKRKG